MHSHETGRKCEDPNCKGDMIDTIINFGENLNKDILDAGFQNGAMSDLCVAMGSSLRVTPAADMPLECARNGGNLVICNLQKTKLDQYATLCIHAKCDDIMQLLMKKLGYAIPEWRKKVRMTLRHKDNGLVQINSVDSNGAPYQIFKKIDVNVKGKPATSFPSVN